MGLFPESTFSVWVEDDRIVRRSPEGSQARIRIDQLRTIWLEAEEGPWGTDWWILQGRDGAQVAFPLGAEGEAAVLELLKQLPGFVVDGMNATERASFRCWAADGD